MSSGSETDVQAVMAKYDRESNTRTFEGIPKKIVHWFFVAFSLYVVYMNLIANWGERERRASFVGLLIIMAFIMYPANRSERFKKRNYIPWYDAVLGLVGAFCFFWFVLNVDRIVNAARPAALTTMDVACAVVGVLIMLEATRRVTGWPIVIVASCFIAYGFLSGTSLRKIVFQLFYTLNGVLGTPIGVCTTFIVLFILFGAFLEMTGVSDFFIRMANALVGSTSGGPAKVAVISSALCGMVSGSSVANTVTTGSVTIPMMKKTGYRGEFAGAVEAAASTGGQIMPPIMGAAAFLMAEFVGIPYAQVAVKAILPAVLYFSGIFIMVHLEAKRSGLKGIPKDQLPHVGRLFLTEGYLLIPLAFLVFVLAISWKSTATCAMYAAVVALVIGAIHKMIPWFTLSKNGITGDEKSKRIKSDSKDMVVGFFDALENGAKNSISVGLACATAGIIAGVVTMTGIGQILITGIVALAGQHVIIALFLTMFACIILGMGVPTTANYVIMATTCAPILTKMGIEPIAAHMFVFYFGIVADITPPVALAAYAGSAIAKANPMKTGLNASRLAIAAFIIPYIFAMSPSMLFVNANAIEVVQIILTSILGMFSVSIGMVGFLRAKVSPLLRIIAIVGGLALIIPGLTTDLVGLAVIVLLVVFQSLKAKKAAAAA
ncbi:MAG: TRAP transporter permease [Ruminococcaceae bacterium]|nr:TRAP transporter permease [Oscillospiraceae bacterium]